PNHLTSTSIQTDQNGNRIQHYEYTAFGRTRYTFSSSAFPVSRRYTSQVLDEDTGLYYYNFRYYDPVLGRFIQPDDIISDLGNPQSYNRYSYVLNDPLRYTDPDGHQEEDFDVPLTLGAGHVASNRIAGRGLARGRISRVVFHILITSKHGNVTQTPGRVREAVLRE
ncbi:MAG: RHS repeat-associated core domain-containing protein, partial [Verrucomicrobiales bacterium]|nr:RHS repeat-associated core domain-containing protein [Verrucomicrobiales bacterium]